MYFLETKLQIYRNNIKKSFELCARVVEKIIE